MRSRDYNDDGRYGSVQIGTETGPQWVPQCCAWCTFFARGSREGVAGECVAGECLRFPIYTRTTTGRWCGEFRKMPAVHA